MFKKENIPYIILTVTGLLLLIIPLIMFTPSDILSPGNALTRFGLHLLAFTGAVALGLMLTSAVSVAGSSTTAVSAISTKVATGVAAAAIVTASTYSIVSTISNPIELTKADILPSESYVIDSSFAYKKDSLDLLDSVSALAGSEGDSANDELTTSVTMQNDESKSEDASENAVEKNENITNDVTEKKTAKTQVTNMTTEATAGKNKLEITKSSEVVSAECADFSLFQGDQPLSRLGFTIYGSKRTIKFKNSCNYVLKDANLNLTRGGKVIESRTLNNNLINIGSFPNLQVDDYLSIEVSEVQLAENGKVIVYALPKPLKKIIKISDHLPTETKDLPAKKKDIVEEETNKYLK